MVYEAVLLRNGEESQTLYWSGSLQETVNLARTIAVEWGADRFRITEFTDSGMELGPGEAVRSRSSVAVNIPAKAAGVR